MKNDQYRKKFPNFREIDYQFADFICKIEKSDDKILFLTALLVSHVTGDQHSALDLEFYSGKSISDFIASDVKNNVRLPTYEKWINVLNGFRNVIGRPDDKKPLILDHGLLYLYRFWAYERLVERKVREFAGQKEDILSKKIGKIRALMPKLFPANGQTHNWQAVATLSTLYSNLCVVSGGPGTGKTYTAARILALHLALDPDIKIGLAAPTGKAAQRISESIKQAKDNLPDEIAQGIPEKAATLHRLLGYNPSMERFKYDADNPLPLDLLIVDEASMVSLPLFARLFEALTPQCRVVFLGDKDQLVSVETGSVFSDLTAPGFLNKFTRDFIDFYHSLGMSGDLPGVGQGGVLVNRVIELQHSFRFGSDSGIGWVSKHVNNAQNPGDAKEVLDTLQKNKFKNVVWKTIDKTGMETELRNAIKTGILKGLSEYWDIVGAVKKGDKKPEDALSALSKFRVLTAVNHGPFGVDGLNMVIKKILGIEKYNESYPGRPIMITKNDYNLHLMNGDVGVLLEVPDHKLMAYFPGEGSEIRSFSIALLPVHVTAFAMTVHKSQGSEFDNVLQILPDYYSPVLTKEIIYTGLTRAKARVEIWADPEVFKKTVIQKTRRTSGLGWD